MYNFVFNSVLCLMANYTGINYECWSQHGSREEHE